MAIHKSREELSREEIGEILSTNAELFKNEPNFVDYIVDLAVYLLENHYDAIIEKRQEAEGGARKPSLDRAPIAVPDALKRSEGDALSDRYKLLRSVSASTRGAAVCMVCGTRVADGRKCPNCGNMMG